MALFRARSRAKKLFEYPRIKKSFCGPVAFENKPRAQLKQGKTENMEQFFETITSGYFAIYGAVIIIGTFWYIRRELINLKKASDNRLKWLADLKPGDLVRIKPGSRIQKVFAARPESGYFLVCDDILDVFGTYLPVRARKVKSYNLAPAGEDKKKI